MNSNSLKLNRTNFLILLLPVVFAGYVLITESSTALVIYVLLFGSLALRDARFFVSAFVPYFLILELLAVPFQYVLVFAFGLLVFVKEVVNRSGKIDLIGVELAGFLFIVISIFSVLLNHNYQNLGIVLGFIVHLVAFYVIAYLVSSRKDGLSFLVMPLVVTTAIVVLVSLSNIDVLTGRIGILGVEHDDRVGVISRMATVCSIGILFCFIFLFNEKDSKVQGLVVFICLACCLYGLILTQSRGQFLALFFAIFLALSFFYSKKRMSSLLFSKKLWAALLGGTVFLGGYFYYSGFKLDDIALLQRLSLAKLDGASDTRMAIWSSGVNSLMSTQELLFGGGHGNFRNVALQGFYAHSVFVDVLYSAGLLGFICLIWLVVKQFYLSVKAGLLAAMAMVFFAVLNNITHGEFKTINFWILLFLSYAITAQHKKESNSQ